MVVGVEANVIEIIVLTTCPDTFLRIGRAWWGVGGLVGPEEVGHELIHPGVGEEQARGLGQQGGRGHDGVFLLLKEVEKALADFRGSHGAEIWNRE